MHYWGDEWFQQYGDELYQAINEIYLGMKKHHIGYMNKEKFGTNREECVKFWSGGLYDIIFGPKFYYYPSGCYKNQMIYKIACFIHNAIYWFDHSIIPYKKTKYGWLKAGYADLNRILGITKLVHKHQAKMYNKVYQQVCKKHPDIIDEILMDPVACSEHLIKPCKWGDIDGDVIYKKYWKTIK